MMHGEIFEHADGEGDVFAVRSWTEGFSPKGDRMLIVGVREQEASPDDFLEVSLLRPQVRALYDALALWLTGEVLERPQGPTPEEIRTMVREEHEKLWMASIATVKPLWEAAHATLTEPGLCRSCDQERPKLSLVHQCSADPEPRETVSAGCECGHTLNLHSSKNGCVHWYEGDQEFCDCTRGLGSKDWAPGEDA